MHESGLRSAKQILRQIPGLHPVIRSGVKLKKRLLRKALSRWTPPQDSIIRIIGEYSKEHRGLSFFQIGSNIGEDQFEEFRWRDEWHGVMVEPQKETFEQLVSRNQHVSGVRFENAAISNSNGMKSLYKIRFTSAPWATNLASFDEKVLKKHIRNGWIAKCCKEDGIELPKNMEDFFATEQVRCLTFSELLRLHPVTSIELVIIDTEGYDFEVIRQLDFAKFPPKFIVFEHKHLDTLNYIRCVQFLRKKGYELFSEGPDTLARRTA